jgi:methylated-DNA-[protein]-cysteine S-methyltransferase
MKFPPDIVQTCYASPLGPMIIAAHGERLAGIWFEGQSHQPDTSRWSPAAEHPLLKKTMAELTEYFAGQRQVFDVPLDLGSGTAFQQAVWQALLTIACGERSSYGALAAAIGKPRAVRAVGGAVGRNPFSIIVPCHRVLGAHGALTGYAGGLERKVKLLQLEGQA